MNVINIWKMNVTNVKKHPRRRINDLQVDDTPILFKDPIIVNPGDEHERAIFIEGLKGFVQELRGKK